MEDGNVWHLEDVARWNSQLLIHTWTFLATISVASQLFLCLFWTNPWLRRSVYNNTLASKTCVKLLKPPKIQIPASNTSFSDLLTHSWFHSMPFALPSYQFPDIVMNRCLCLKQVSLYSTTNTAQDKYIWLAGRLLRTTQKCTCDIESLPLALALPPSLAAQETQHGNGRQGTAVSAVTNPCESLRTCILMSRIC
jgi:hypothetical protein